MGSSDLDESRSSKACTTCGEKIAASARKCIHCGTWQDWRRYLVFSNTVLALLVALVSVAAVAGPVFRDMLVTKDSRLIGSFQGVTDNEAVFVIFNSGNRPGTTGEVSVLIASLFPDGGIDSPVLTKHLSPASNYREEAFFVEPGQSKVIKYTSSEPQATFADIETGRLQCGISINLTNFLGRRSEPCFVSDCSQLLSVVFPYVKKRSANDYSGPKGLSENCRPDS
jgi:hypothetical protein